MKQNGLVRNDTEVVVVDFKSAEEESELSISKARSWSRSRLFQKSGVGVSIFEIGIWESDLES